MKPSVLKNLVVASLLTCLVAPLEAAVNKPVSGTTRTNSQVTKSVSNNKKVRSSRAKVRRTKREMNDLAKNIEALQASGGNLAGQPSTQAVVNRAINAHGAAVRSHTATVATAVRTFVRRNNIDVVPDPPTTAPPRLPRGAAPAGQASLNTGTPNVAPPQQLAPPPAPPPTRRDMRPAGNTSGQRLVNTQPNY